MLAPGQTPASSAVMSCQRDQKVKIVSALDNVVGMGYSRAVNRLGSFVDSSLLEDLQHVCGPQERFCASMLSYSSLQISVWRSGNRKRSPGLCLALTPRSAGGRGELETAGAVDRG
jgi:hypothetical protein